MVNFLESYGALALAFIALVQFWAKILWDRYFRKGKIEYYETGTIVIGYNAPGPTLGLSGTLRALNKDVFIKSIDLLVIRETDKAQHTFKWIAFQSPRTDVSGSQPTLMEISSGFMISPNSPHRFNIIFSDNDLFRDIRPLLNEYSSEWYKTTEELNKIWPSTSAPPELSIITQKNAVIDKFRNKSKIHLDTFTALDRKCYWEAGDYKLIINVTASKPNQTFNKKYRFSISEADSKILKLNVITILEEPISGYFRISNPPYNWSFAEYIPE